MPYKIFYSNEYAPVLSPKIQHTWIRLEIYLLARHWSWLMLTGCGAVLSMRWNWLLSPCERQWWSCNSLFIYGSTLLLYWPVYILEYIWLCIFDYILIGCLFVVIVRMMIDRVEERHLVLRNLNLSIVLTGMLYSLNRRIDLG